MDIIKSIEHEQLKNKIPELKVGNTVRVHVRIKEGNKERIQVFEGIIIKKQGGGVNATFTVRKIAYGVGVEKTFLVHSPLVEKVELVRVGKARRAKLYYLRDRLGKAAKTKEQIGARIENNNIVVNENMETTVPGLYACGDCTGGLLQVNKAVYEGTIAALDIIKNKNIEIGIPISLSILIEFIVFFYTHYIIFLTRGKLGAMHGRYIYPIIFPALYIIGYGIIRAKEENVKYLPLMILPILIYIEIHTIGMTSVWWN